MVSLPLRFVLLTFLLISAINANAVEFCEGGSAFCGQSIEQDVYEMAALPALLENNFIEQFGLDVDLSVPGLIGDHLYASGDVYIDSDYFYAHVASGLTFDQDGSLFFVPAADSASVNPDFSSWDFSGGIGFSGSELPIDYLITADVSEAIKHFHSMGDIYITNVAYSEVPVPAAAWMFGSALLSLVLAKRKKPVSHC